MNYKRKLSNMDDSNLAKSHPFGIEVSSDPEGYQVWEISYFKSECQRDQEFSQLPYVDMEAV